MLPPGFVASSQCFTQLIWIFIECCAGRMASHMFFHLGAKVPTSSAVCRAAPDASVLCALDVWHMRVRSLQINRLTGAWLEFHPARRKALRRLSACASGAPRMMCVRSKLAQLCRFSHPLLLPIQPFTCAGGTPEREILTSFTAAAI